MLTATDLLLKRQQLKQSLQECQLTLLSLINNDYEHFINLSVELTSVPEYLQLLQSGLEEQHDHLSSNVLKKWSGQVKQLNELTAKKKIITDKKFILGDLLKCARSLDVLAQSPLNDQLLMDRLRFLVDLVMDSKSMLNNSNIVDEPFLKVKNALIGQQERLYADMSRHLSTLLLKSMEQNSISENGAPYLEELLQLINMFDPLIIGDAIIKFHICENQFLDPSSILTLLTDKVVPVLNSLRSNQHLIFHRIVEYLLVSSALANRQFSVSSKSFHADYSAYTTLFSNIGHLPFASKQSTQLMADYMSSKFNINLFFSIQFKQVIGLMAGPPPPPSLRSSASQQNLNASDSSLNIVDNYAGILTRFRNAIRHLDESFIEQAALKYLKVLVQCCLYLDREMGQPTLHVNDVSIIAFLEDFSSSLAEGVHILKRWTADSQNANEVFRQCFISTKELLGRLKERFVAVYSKQMIDQVRMVKNVPILYRRKSETLVLTNLFQSMPAFPEDTVKAYQDILVIDMLTWTKDVSNIVVQEFLKSVRDLLSQMESLRKLKRASVDDGQDREIMHCVAQNVQFMITLVNGTIKRCGVHLVDDLKQLHDTVSRQ